MKGFNLNLHYGVPFDERRDTAEIKRLVLGSGLIGVHGQRGTGKSATLRYLSESEQLGKSYTFCM